MEVFIILKFCLFKKSNNFAKDMESKLDQYRTELNLREKSINDLQEKFEELKNQLISSKNENLEKNLLIKRFRESQEQQDLKINSLKEENFLFREKLEAFSDYSKLKNETVILKEQLDESQNRILSFEKEISQLEKENIKILKEFESYKINVDKNNEKENKNYKKITIEEFKDFSDKLIELNNVKEKLIESNNLVTKFKDKSNELFEEKQDLLFRIKNFGAEVAKNTAFISKLQSDLISKENECNNLKQKLSSATENIVTLKRRESLNAEKINEYQNLNQDLVSLKSELDQKIKEIPLKEKVFHDEKQKYEKEISKLRQSLQDKTIPVKLEKEFNEKRVEMVQSLSCLFCKKSLDQAVTCIPCGHSYCKRCSSAYENGCYTCGKSQKIDAVYRNEVLDDIMHMWFIIKNLMDGLTKIT